MVVERTRLTADGRAEGTGETYEIPAGLVVSCIGYRTPPIPGVPYDERAGRFDNRDGRVPVDGANLYAVGWARRGPTDQPDRAGALSSRYRTARMLEAPRKAPPSAA